MGTQYELLQINDNEILIKDCKNDIICTFERGKFQDTQKFKFDRTKFDAMQLDRVFRDLTNYLYYNYPELVE